MLLRVGCYSIAPVVLVAWLSWRLTERPFLQYRRETASSRLSGAIGWVVHRPWLAAAATASALVLGVAVVGNYLQAAGLELAS